MVERDSKNRMMGTLITFLFVLLWLLSAPNVSAKTRSTLSPSKYITNITVKKSGDYVVVSYTAKELPKGFRCSIIYGDERGHYQKAKSIGAKGRHTVKWKMIGGVSVVSAKLTAASYMSKQRLKNVYNVKTGTTYHQVTKAEERRGKMVSTAVGVGIGAVGLLPSAGAYTVQLFVAGSAATVLGNFYYVPQYPNYIKTKTSFLQSTRTVTVTVTIYAQKNGKKLKTYTFKMHL